MGVSCTVNLCRLSCGELQNFLKQLMRHSQVHTAYFRNSGKKDSINYLSQGSCMWAINTMSLELWVWQNYQVFMTIEINSCFTPGPALTTGPLQSEASGQVHFSQCQIYTLALVTNSTKILIPPQICSDNCLRAVNYLGHETFPICRVCCFPCVKSMLDCDWQMDVLTRLFVLFSCSKLKCSFPALDLCWICVWKGISLFYHSAKGFGEWKQNIQNWIQKS